MSTQDHDPVRRRFLRLTLLGAAAVPVSGLLLQSPRVRAQERVEESDSAAKSLNYRHDASEVEHDAYQDGQKCSNCQLYSADAGDEGWGACGALGGRLVNAEGWCTAYVAAS